MALKGIDSFASIRPEWVPQLKALGYGWAARYYRRAPLTGGKGNAVSREEVAALHANGLAFLPVYQNTSDRPEYFTVSNGLLDAAAALAKADDMGQPRGTAIYFAVDTNPKPDDGNDETPDLGNVISYFRVLKSKVWGDGDYNVGVYGSGLVCEMLKKIGLVDFTWEANAEGWFGTKQYEGWDVKQKTLPFTLPFGLQVDGNEARNDAGMWKPPALVPAEIPSLWQRVTGWFR